MNPRDFTIRLGSAFWRQGFFNVPKAMDRYIGGDREEIEVKLGESGRPIVGEINRRANQNGTARIMGRVPLRDFFHANWNLGDTVRVRIEAPNKLVVGVRVTA